MRLIVLSLFSVVVFSCNSSSKLASKSEKELVSGFENLLNQFNALYNVEQNKDTIQLNSLNDSLKLYVEALLEKDTTNSSLANLYFSFGETSMKLKNSELALKYYNALVLSFPNNEDVPRALYNIAYTYENILHDTDLAIEKYKYLYKTYPETKWAENARSQVLYLNNPSFIGE